MEPGREMSEETQVDINLSDVLVCFYFKLINMYNFLEFFLTVDLISPFVLFKKKN